MISHTQNSNHNAENNKRENHSAFIASPSTIRAMNGTLIVELTIMWPIKMRNFKISWKQWY